MFNEDGGMGEEGGGSLPDEKRLVSEACAEMPAATKITRAHDMGK